jgi:hypothetical protein
VWCNGLRVQIAKGQQSLMAYYSNSMSLRVILHEVLGSCIDPIQLTLMVSIMSESFSCSVQFSLDGKSVKCKQCKVVKWCNFHFTTHVTKWTIKTHLTGMFRLGMVPFRTQTHRISPSYIHVV